jgi:hypothetical protein
MKIGTLALLAAIGACGDRSRERKHSEQEAQAEMLSKYIHTGYTMWSLHHPGQQCPASLQEVADEIGLHDTNDVWGRPLMSLCGDGGFEVRTVGRDGNESSVDDLALRTRR